MRTRYQEGSLLLDERYDTWVYRWRERLSANGTPQSFATLGDVVKRYIAEKMPERYSTQAGYRSYITKHILPKWGEVPVADIKAYPIENWLKQLELSGKTKSNLKNILRRLLDCAMLWELIEPTRNPMELVEVKGVKRRKQPRVLSGPEFHRLLLEIDEEPFRTMVVTAMCLGLRCSELLALKWSDFNWDKRLLLVQRAVVAGRVGEVKTRYSEAPVPLDSSLVELLLDWKRRSEFNGEYDWVWASPFQAGEKPYLSWGIQQRRIKPAGLRAQLGPIGWHTFRHTYRSWLDETGAPLTVQQELMRHADIRTTMNVYGSAMAESKREANSKVVRIAIPA
jgi:integrase